MALIELSAAREAVLSTVATLSGETVELDEALGRVLAQDVQALHPIPGFDASAMDGFAVRAADLVGASVEAPARLTVVAESRAGSPAPMPLAEGEAIAISTGAMLPQGADAIVRVEDAQHVNGSVELLVSVPTGWDVRRAGEDVRAGDTVLEAGETLRPPAIGVLASLGARSVCCARRPRIAIVLTGDELVGPDEQLRPGAVRDSNSHAIGALARCYGAEAVATRRAPDDREQTERLLEQACAGVDALVVCGGMSVGVHDHVRPALNALGARQSFWGIALKPGKPTWFGTLDRTPVFGLPGNPVSAMVTFALLVGPALRAMQGAPLEELDASAILDEDYEKESDRAHALRCRLEAREDGWHASLTGSQGSHILTSMLDADALLVVPTRQTSIAAGTRLQVQRLPYGMLP